MRHVLCLVLFFSAWHALYGQHITVIDSITRLPVAGAVITNSGRTRSQISDTNGRFSCSDFSFKDTLLVLHVAYCEKKLPFSQLENKTRITLIPKTITNPSITITGERVNEKESSFSSRLEILPSDRMTSHSAAEVLERRSTLMIKDYGGFGGLKTVSSRGMNAENTLVLFNDARVNDLRTGVFDLSTISTQNAGSIKYSRGFDPEHPFSSGGGVLSINSVIPEDKTEKRAWFRYTTDDLKSVGAVIQDNTNGIRYRVTGEYSDSRNEFPYRFQGKDYNRKNAQFTRKLFSGDMQYKDGNSSVGLYTGYSFLNNGIPGFVVTNNDESSDASTNSGSLLSVLNFKYYPESFYSLAATISYNRQSMEIKDPSGALSYKDSRKESGLNDAAISVKSAFYFGKLTGVMGYEFMSSDVENTATFFVNDKSNKNISRISNRAYMGGEFNMEMLSGFNGNLDVNILATAERVNETGNADNSDMLYMLKGGVKLSLFSSDRLKLKANYADEYRLPTFNERYFSSLYGQSKLKREKNRWYDFGLQFNYNLLGPQNLEVAYFKIISSEKIIWTPTYLALMVPRNIASASVNGLECGWSGSTVDSVFSLYINYVYTDARNLARQSEQDLSYNKYLIYSPLHRGALGLSVSVSGITISLTGRFVDSRYYSSDNSPRSLLPYYFIVDGAVTYKAAALGMNHSIALSVYNLNNQEYFVIQSYPMPLRTFLITYNLEIL